MKSITKFTFILVIFISTSCIQKLREAAENITESVNSSESLSENNYSIITIDSLYQLNVPKYMKNMPSLHPEASLEYANIYKETYTIVIEEDKQNFVNTFKEYGEYNDELSSVENYMIAQKKMFQESIEGVRIQEYGLEKINNQPARQIKMEGIVDGIDFFYLIGFVEGEKNIYMIMNWTLKDRRHKYENTFEFINGSFKVL